MRKLKNDRGETLVEVLASVLIAALSVTLLFSCIMASARMNENAKAQDSVYYADFTNADAQSGTPTEGIVTVEGSGTEMTPGIDIYGSGGVFSYKRKQP